MDPKLAMVYGTAPVNETDVEALATAELATKLAAADEIDVDGMSDAQAEELAQELLGGNSTAEEGGEEPAATEEPAVEEPAAEEEEKTAGDETTPEQEKIAEADYLGRVMAHAYVNERKEIEKAAAAAVAKPKTASDKTTVVKPIAKTAAKKDPKDGKVMAALKSKKASAEAPVEEPKMSALDTLAQQRALEILKENGIDPAAEQETEKKSSMNEEQAALLAAKVEERAQALLVSQGYEFKTEEAPTEEK